MKEQTPDRSFPRPWSTKEEGESFRVIDATGFPVCYVYYEDEKSRADLIHRVNRRQAEIIASRIAAIGVAE